MVLKQAVKLSTDTKVRFAALCHDLGKGITPEQLMASSQKPDHSGHENAGLPLVEKTCQRLKVPNAYKELALKACQYHLNVHRAFELKPSTIFKLLESVKATKSQILLEQLLIVCHADATGRAGFEDNDYPQRAYLLEQAKQVLLVTAKSYVEQGLQGRAIKEAMDKERLELITQLKAKYTS